MSPENASLTDWLTTAPGQYLLRWEIEHIEESVSDVFGFHAVQLGLPALDALRGNRMPHRWLAADGASISSDGVVQTPAADRGLRAVSLVADATALPFMPASLDLLVLPHTLELSHDPHAALREAERVLVPEGRVVITGLNPNSLWGFRQSRGHLYKRWGKHGQVGDLFLPESGEFIGHWRLRDWLRLLNFEVESSSFGCYAPAFTSQKWLNRVGWMDRVGPRWWPIFGAVYCVVAVKRVHGVRLLEPAWKLHPNVAAAPSAIANKGATRPRVR